MTFATVRTDSLRAGQLREEHAEDAVRLSADASWNQTAIGSSLLGTSKESPSSRICFFARTRRCATAVGCAKSALEIWPTLKPATVFSVKATRLSADKLG